MTVKPSKVEPKHITRVDSGRYRTYITPEGNRYPSVTSVLNVKPNEAIERWREAVGFEEAQAITRRSAARGTVVHQMCEDYLNGKKVQPLIFDMEMFDQLKPELNEISHVYGLELPLYSDKLKTCGTSDCVGVYKGMRAIIDFKTSNHVKHREDISSYFMQCAAYAIMFEELYNISIPYLVIIMTIEASNHPVVFVEKRNDWILPFVELRTEFKKVYGD
jgi:hypothetical protein